MTRSAVLLLCLMATCLAAGVRAQDDSDTSPTAPVSVRVWNLSERDTVRLNELMTSGTIQKLLYGPAGEPASPDRSLVLDTRQSILVLTDEELQQGRLHAILRGWKKNESLMRVRLPLDMERIEEIRPVLDMNFAPTDFVVHPEHVMMIEGDELVLVDTPERVAAMTDVLRAKGFLVATGERGELAVAEIRFKPRTLDENDAKAVRHFRDEMVAILRAFLYTTESPEEAEREGRSVEFDENTFMLVVRDYPHNIVKVQESQFLALRRDRRVQNLTLVAYVDPAELIEELKAEFEAIGIMIQPVPNIMAIYLRGQPELVRAAERLIKELDEMEAPPEHLVE